MALTIDKQLLVACYQKGVVAVISPNGQVVDYIFAGGAYPTNIAFGGKENKKLYITEIETNSVYIVDLGIEGQPLFG